MRIICVYIEHFPAAIETREREELQSRPIVIGGYPHERKRVFDCSLEAANLSIAPGMPLRQAHHLCPDAVFLPLDKDKYLKAFDEVLDILDRFSPLVEVANLGKAFLDGSGLSGLYGPDENLALRIRSEISSRTRLEPGLGIAGSKFVAEVVATQASPQCPCIIKNEREKDFLEPLPSSLLPVSEDMKRRLDILGLRTMGQIASLPLNTLATQFGEEGVLAHQLANGIDNRPLVPRAKPTILEQELSFENPLESVDTILTAIDRLLDKLIAALRDRNQVCGQIRLHFCIDGTNSWHDSLNLREPTDSQREIIPLIKHRLESAHFSAGVTDIRLGFTQLGGETARQNSLLTRERVRQDAQLKCAARQLQVRLGKNLLKKVIQVDPGSRIPERRSGLIDFKP